MGAYKQFLASDIIVTPFEVNKGFTFISSSQLFNEGVDRFLGQNLQSSPFISGSNTPTGYISLQDPELVYGSIKELYYSNYVDGIYGSPIPTASLIPGMDSSGDAYVGVTTSQGRYFNYLQTDLTFQRFFPTESNAEIGVISIPGHLFGNYIQPNSFFLKCESGSISDDGEGNLIDNSTNLIVGNIFYYHGIAVLTSESLDTGGYGSAVYGMSLYGGGGGGIDYINNFINSNNITCSFSSSLTIYETQYQCTVRDNEYNFTLNPSVSSGSTEITSSIGTFYTPGQYLYSWATGSNFSPYVTTVGLYNENYELLAIGKLSQPLPLSPTTDTTILINIDR